MKLRFKGNSLRLRLNQKEVTALVSGHSLEEQVVFPGDAKLVYVLEAASSAGASFSHGTIRVQAPQSTVSTWAKGEDIGLYFDFPSSGAELKVAIEKDLECVDGPPEEVDVDAFPRLVGKSC